MQTNAEAQRGNGSEQAEAPDALSGVSRFFEAVQEFDERVRSLARERPVAAVLAAVGVGFVLGRLLGGSERSPR